MLVVSVLLGAPQPSKADARTDYLIRSLSTASSFRVRAQAALSLGQLRSSEQIVSALSTALQDRHPAVRTAAATALRNLADPAGLPALERARRDRNQDVSRAVESAIASLQRVAAARGAGRATGGTVAPTPRGPARYYVGVGAPSGSVSEELREQAQSLLRREVGNIEGVELAPERESNAAARRTVQSRRLTGFYIDSRIVSVERTSAGTRVQVSVIVGTYPGRDMRAMLQGSATAGGAQSPRAERLALEGAIRGALRQLPQAFAASADR